MFDQLVDAGIEQFELASTIDLTVLEDQQTLTFDIEVVIFGDIQRFDHPLESFIGVGLAIGLGRPISSEVQPTESGEPRHVVYSLFDADEGDRTTT